MSSVSGGSVINGATPSRYCIFQLCLQYSKDPYSNWSVKHSKVQYRPVFQSGTPGPGFARVAPTPPTHHLGILTPLHWTVCTALFCTAVIVQCTVQSTVWYSVVYRAVQCTVQCSVQCSMSGNYSVNMSDISTRCLCLCVNRCTVQ